MLLKLINLFILLCLMCCWRTCNSKFPLVRVAQGLLKGSYMNTTQGRRFSAFSGIPYAKPPIGNLRFKAPVPANKWNGTYDASKEASVCPQMRSRVYTGDENCLTLTVYTHSVNSYKKVPVLVYIHGGSLMIGSVRTSEYPPERLMNEAIVFVLPQYRLSALGGLSTGDAASPGNYGFLDQALALQWVEKNIHKFGGDPKRVTLGGVSAGGASVGLQLASPVSRGLFRAALIQSGPTLASISINPAPLPLARRLGTLLNCTSSESKALVDCLRSKSARQIIENAALVPGIQIPVVEDCKYGKFLFDTPTNLYTRGQFSKVPTIIGTVKDEGDVVLSTGIVEMLESVPAITDDLLDNIFDVIVPSILQIGIRNDTNLRNLSYAAKEEYAKIYNYYDKKQLTKFLMDIVGDVVIRAPAAKQTLLMAANNATVYLYSFEYEGDLSGRSYFGEKAVNHGDDVRYLLYPNLTERDSQFSKKFRNMLTNFIYFLDPTPKDMPTKWDPTSAAEELWYLEIGNETMDMKEGYFTEQLRFWNVIAPTIIGN